ncbi:hypothetical protein Esti_003290 [Eimeria stiedai]
MSCGESLRRGFAALLQQPLLQPVSDQQQLKQLQQQGRAFAVTPVKGLECTRGLGFVALQRLPRGFVVYEDEPVVWLQHGLSKGLIRACCCCGGPLGGPLSQLSHFFSALPGSKQFLEAQGLDQQVLLQLHEHQQQLQRQQQREVVLCPGGCGEAYCSKACLSADSIHPLLCVGPLGEGAPLVAFKRLAVESCENLLLVAAVVVAAATAAATVAASAEETAAAANELLLLLLQHVHGSWEAEGEEAAAEKEEASDLSAAAQRKEFVVKAAELLLLSLQPRSEVYRHLITPALVSHLLSLFERNNLDISIPSPLNTAFTAFLNRSNSSSSSSMEREVQRTLKALLVEKEVVLFSLFGAEGEEAQEEDASLSSASEEEAAAAARKRFAAKRPEELLFEGGGRAFPGVMGSGFFCSVARINHACSPNLAVEDTSAPRDTASAFGFQCNCDACARQKP